MGYTRNSSHNKFIRESPELELFIHQLPTNSSQNNSSLSREILNLTSLDPPNSQWKHYLVQVSPNTTTSITTVVEIKLLRPLDTGHIFIR